MSVFIVFDHVGDCIVERCKSRAIASARCAYYAHLIHAENFRTTTLEEILKRFSVEEIPVEGGF